MNLESHISGRMSAKQLERLALKAKQSHLLSEKRAKEALAVGNTAAARVHAESAIRQKNEALHYLRLQAQIEGVNSRAASMQMNRTAVEQISEASRMMEAAMPPGELERAADVLESFVDKSEQLDIADKTMTSALDDANSLSTPQGEVDNLLRRFAEEDSIDVAGLLPDAPRVGTSSHETHGQYAVTDSGRMRYSVPK